MTLNVFACIREYVARLYMMVLGFVVAGGNEPVGRLSLNAPGMELVSVRVSGIRAGRTLSLPIVAANALPGERALKAIPFQMLLTTFTVLPGFWYLNMALGREFGGGGGGILNGGIRENCSAP